MEVEAAGTAAAEPMTAVERTDGLKGFALEYEIKTSSGQCLFAAGTFIQVRKPNAGALRGIKMVELANLDFAAIETLGPRITEPQLHKQAINEMDPVDFMALGGEIMDFLLPGAVKKEALASLPQ